MPQKNMCVKISVIFLIVFIMFAPFIIENSYAQSTQLSSTSTSTANQATQLSSTSTSPSTNATNNSPPKHYITYGLVQIQVRNSQGQLVSYLEAKDAQLLDPDTLNQYLDTQNATGTVDYGDVKFQLFQFETDDTKTFQGSTSHADLVLARGEKQYYAIRVITDGFWYNSGDKITQLWTIVRTA